MYLTSNLSLRIFPPDGNMQEGKKEPSLTSTFLWIALWNYKSNNLFWSIATNQAWQLQLACYAHCMNIKACKSFFSSRSCFEIVVFFFPHLGILLYWTSSCVDVTMNDWINANIGCDKIAFFGRGGKIFWATLPETFTLLSIFFWRRNTITSIWQDAVFWTNTFPNASKLKL